MFARRVGRLSPTSADQRITNKNACLMGASQGPATTNLKDQQHASNDQHRTKDNTTASVTRQHIHVYTLVILLDLVIFLTSTLPYFSKIFWDDSMTLAKLCYKSTAAAAEQERKQTECLCPMPKANLI